MIADPVQAAAVEVFRHLRVGERMPGCLLRHPLRVARLPGDVRCDPLDRVIGAVRLGVVADVEVQAALGRNRHPHAGGETVAGGHRRQRQREADGKKDCRPQVRAREEHDDHAGDGHDDVGPVQRLQAEQDARRERPRVRPPIRRQRHRERREGRGGQRRVERGLQQDRFVEREDPGERRRQRGDPGGAAAEPLAGGHEDAADAGGPERGLQHPDGRERVEERQHAREPVDVQRRHEIEARPQREVAATDAVGERDVRGGVDPGIGLEQRMIAKLDDDDQLDQENEGKEEEQSGSTHQPAIVVPAPPGGAT